MKIFILISSLCHPQNFFLPFIGFDGFSVPVSSVSFCHQRHIFSKIEFWGRSQRMLGSRLFSNNGMLQVHISTVTTSLVVPTYVGVCWRNTFFGFLKKVSTNVGLSTKSTGGSFLGICISFLCACLCFSKNEVRNGTGSSFCGQFFVPLLFFFAPTVPFLSSPSKNLHPPHVTQYC